MGVVWGQDFSWKLGIGSGSDLATGRSSGRGLGPGFQSEAWNRHRK